MNRHPNVVSRSPIAPQPRHDRATMTPIAPLPPAPPVFARGTRELAPLPATPEPPLGVKWYLDARIEMLGRNLAVAGALRFAYLLGRAHDEFERLQR